LIVVSHKDSKYCKEEEIQATNIGKKRVDLWRLQTGFQREITSSKSDFGEFGLTIIG
jgi:hypothetical protein